MPFEACQVVFWSPSCCWELKLITNPFAGHTLRGCLIQLQNISLWGSGMRREQNCFLSSPLFSLFLPHFFSFAGHLVGFILVGKVFRKAFRILGLGERKGRWVVEQDFHGNFEVSVTWFFAFFSGVLDWIVLNLVWFERSPHSAHVSVQSCPWPLKLMMSQAVVESTWTRAAQGWMG